MRRIALCCCAVALAACSKPKEQPPAEAPAAAETQAAPPAPAPLALADLAGKWNMRTMPENSDSTLVKYEMVATADTTGWEFHFPKRKPVPVHPTAAGDSLVLDAGPYESVLRKGVQVTTHSVSRLQDGKLVGATTAHYKTTGPDSVRQLRVEGTRAQ
jgi:glucose/arabinose dehydrogenase